MLPRNRLRRKCVITEHWGYCVLTYGWYIHHATSEQYHHSWDSSCTAWLPPLAAWTLGHRRQSWMHREPVGDNCNGLCTKFTNKWAPFWCVQQIPFCPHHTWKLSFPSTLCWLQHVHFSVMINIVQTQTLLHYNPLATVAMVTCRAWNVSYKCLDTFSTIVLMYQIDLILVQTHFGLDSCQIKLYLCRSTP